MTAAVLVIGAGGFGRAVAEMLSLGDRFKVCGFVDDRWPELQEVDGWPVLGGRGDLARLRQPGNKAVCAVGNNRVREAVFAEASACGFDLPSFVHPSAWVSPSAVLGPGCLVMAGAVVSAHVRMGPGVLVNAGAVIDHDALLEGFCMVGVGACVEGAALLRHGDIASAGTVTKRG